jgi:hypothetical protein
VVVRGLRQMPNGVHEKQRVGEILEREAPGQDPIWIARPPGVFG